MERFKRNQKGITLIALIVTIIVLLILAGISITTLTGENGLITRTTSAVEKQKEAAALEEVKLAMEAVKLDKMVVGEDIVLNIFTEATNVAGRNALEKELYTQDDNVIAAIEDEYLVVDYKGYEFLFDGDLGVTIGKNNKVVITVTPIIGTATVSSLNISSNIVGLDDLSQIEKRYYSVDNGETWRDGGTDAEYTYTGLTQGTTYNVKVKIELKNKPKQIESGMVLGTTLSLDTILAEYKAKIPADFFTTNDAGDTITGINEEYKDNYQITYKQDDPTKAFDGTLVIPATWKGKNITAIDSNAFEYIGNIQKLYIEEGIGTIGDEAFCHCDGLTEVSLPTTLVTIGENRTPFNYCENITKVTIPKRIASSNDLPLYMVFSYSVEKITDVNFNVKENDPITVIGNMMFNGCAGLIEINIPNTVIEIGSYAFQSCTGLTSITIPANVKIIGNNAFYNCSGLTDVTLMGVVEIGSNSFQYCEGLKNLTLNEGLKEIGDEAFCHCDGLTEVNLPTTLENIGSNRTTFDYCENITKVTIPKRIASSNDLPLYIVFGYSEEKITEVNYNVKENDPITVIGESLFQGCEALIDLNIPSTVTEIGAYAFAGCKGLTSITIPANVKIIGNNAFYNCSGLTDVTLMGIEELKYNSFEYCENLKNLTLNEGLKEIGDEAFRNCSSLTEVILPTTLETISTNRASFSNCENITKVTIPKSIASSNDLPLYMVFSYSVEKITDVNFNVKENDPITVIGNMMFNGCAGLTEINIPNTVIEIGSYAFQSCTGLTSITIPASVKKIGNNSFNGCNQLNSIILQDGLEEIEWRAFDGCDSLTSIVIPSTVNTMYGSWDGTFYGCTNLRSITVKKAKDSISGAPWAAPNMNEEDVVWQP